MYSFHIGRDKKQDERETYDTFIIIFYYFPLRIKVENT